MTLSRLQRYILSEVFQSQREPFTRRSFGQFYKGIAKPPKDAEAIITRSLERLIDNELLVGYGRRTPHKWFIEEVRLTRRGRQVAKRQLGEQQRLNLFKKR